jgi:hypothetical protein
MEIIVCIYITTMNILSIHICNMKVHFEKPIYVGEMERYSHLMHVTQNRANGSSAALNETKRRTKEMLSLNEQIENTIQQIPASLRKTQTTMDTQRSLWLPWRKTTSTRIISSMVRPLFTIFV